MSIFVVDIRDRVAQKVCNTYEVDNTNRWVFIEAVSARDALAVLHCNCTVCVQIRANYFGNEVQAQDNCWHCIVKKEPSNER